MAGKAQARKGFGKKLKDQQDDNKTLYSLANQGTIIQSNASAISSGSQGGGSWLTTAMSDINMNTYDIRDVDRLYFAAKEGAGEVLTADDFGMEAIYTGGNAYGLSIRYPAGASHIFQIVKGTTELINIADTIGMTTNMPIHINDSWLDIGNQPTPASPSSGYRRIFVDEDNSDHLTVLKTDGSEIDLEAAGSGANTTLSNLGTTSVNSNLIMQAGISVTNLEGVFFATRSATPIAGSITYDGTDLIGKKSDNTEVNLTTPTSANTSLSNLSATAVNVDLDPDNSGTNPHLGDATKIWEVIYGQDIHVSGDIKTEPTSDHTLNIFTGGGNRFAISDNASNGAGYAELFGVIAGSGETQTHPSYKTVATDASPADNDMVGALGFDGYNSAISRLTWARIVGVSDVVASSSETAHFEFKAFQSGTEKTMLETDQFGIYLSNDIGGGTAPAYNGAIWRDGNDVKIYSGGAVRNLSDL